MTARILVLLPPSETKRDGGNTAFRGRLTGCGAAARRADARLAVPGALAWPRLEPIRTEVADALVALAADEAATAAALKLSAKLAASEATRNRALRTAPRLPAVLRYTGVLYDALEAETLDDDAWGGLARHVAVHSALYGLVGAAEPIAAYRLSAGSRLPGEPLKRRWSDAVSRELAAHDGTIVELRSASYVGLGAAPADAIGVDIVADDGAGGVRALNHFNKQAKGELVRALATAPELRELPGRVSAAALAEALRDAGFEASEHAPGRIRLTVDQPRAGGVGTSRRRRIIDGPGDGPNGRDTTT